MKKSILALIIMCTSLFSYAQTENSAGDVIDYREVDGKIVVTAMVNGKMADFALDLAGHCTIMESEMAKLTINPAKLAKLPYNDFICRNYTPKSCVEVSNVSVGNIASALGAKFFVIVDEPYLKELGVVGTLDVSIFSKHVLTLDTDRKKITLTAPYRPPYMKLDHRTDCEMTTGSTVQLKLNIDGVDCDVTIDTWNSAAVALTSGDYAKIAQGKNKSTDGVMSICFGKNSTAKNQFSASEVSFVKSKFNNMTVVENSSLKKSTVGLNLIKNGVLSLDFNKGKVYFQPHNLVAIDDSTVLPKDVNIVEGKLNPITAKYFKENIFDYTKGGEFVSKSDKIYVIDFWATWCGPCMKLLPQMEVLADKYKGKVVFLKVNADKEKELCNSFNVNALPTIFFITPNGKPIIEIGATPEKFEQIIEKILQYNTSQNLDSNNFNISSR